jgi:hypothetical protein
MAKMNKSKNWKQNWAALLPKKYARPNRGDLERKQVVLEQVPFTLYETIHHLEPTTEF